MSDLAANWYVRTAHYSDNMTGAARVNTGRAGPSLCKRATVYDQDAIDAIRARWTDTTKQITELPVCKACAKIAAKLEGDGHDGEGVEQND